MKRIIVELSNERLITPSGLTLVGAALGKIFLSAWTPEMMPQKTWAF